MRLLGVLALVLVFSPTVYTVASGSAGRDYSRCIQACNDSRRACDDRCDVDCKSMYPDSVSQRNACLNTCHAICIDQSGDCKLVCQAIKNGECPTEP